MLDREFTTASLDYHFSLTSDLGSLWHAIRQETRFTALSGCSFYERRLIAEASQVGAPDPTGSNLSCGVLVLNSAEDTYTTISIPGFRGDLLLQDGCFAAQKIDMLHADMIALSAGIMAHPLVTQRGDTVLALSAGGAMNMWSTLTSRSG